jgi:hypothetical protein
MSSESRAIPEDETKTLPALPTSRARVTNYMLTTACEKAEKALIAATGKQLVVDYVSRRGKWSVEIQGVAIALNLTKTECYKQIVMVAELVDFVTQMTTE